MAMSETCFSIKNNIFKGKKILITGHTGFKGAWLSLWLNMLGANVIGYALNPPTKPNFFDACNIKNKIVSITADVRDKDMLIRIFKKYKPDMVFHMAAQSLVRCSYMYPLETYETNVMGTVNLLEACRLSDSVKIIINVTSDKCYENAQEGSPHLEADPKGGCDPYSSSKGCSELITTAYIESYFSGKPKNSGVSLASVRAGNVIGGGDWAQDRLVPDCIRAFVKKRNVNIRNPGAVRPWQHVLEPLSGYMTLAVKMYENRQSFSGGWNFGPDAKDMKPVKWLVEYIVKRWSGYAGWKEEKSNDLKEVKYLRLDCGKAKTRLGWSPNWDLRTALEKTVDWYKAYYNRQDMYGFTLNQIREYKNGRRK